MDSQQIHRAGRAGSFRVGVENAASSHEACIAHEDHKSALDPTAVGKRIRCDATQCTAQIYSHCCPTGTGTGTRTGTRADTGTRTGTGTRIGTRRKIRRLHLETVHGRLDVQCIGDLHRCESGRLKRSKSRQFEFHGVLVIKKRWVGRTERTRFHSVFATLVCPPYV